MRWLLIFAYLGSNTPAATGGLYDTEGQCRIEGDARVRDYQIRHWNSMVHVVCKPVRGEER